MLPLLQLSSLAFWSEWVSKTQPSLTRRQSKTLLETSAPKRSAASTLSPTLWIVWSNTTNMSTTLSRTSLPHEPLVVTLPISKRWRLWLQPSPKPILTWSPKRTIRNLWMNLLSQRTEFPSWESITTKKWRNTSVTSECSLPNRFYPLLDMRNKTMKDSRLRIRQLMHQKTFLTKSDGNNEEGNTI